MSKKDWTDNTSSIFKNLGASSHAAGDREENDYYATNPKAVKMLLELEKFEGKIWEPACGEGHISKELIKHGFDVKSSDIINRGYGEVIDFLNSEIKNFNGNIITNPPYKYAEQFVKKSLVIIPVKSKIAMFLKIQFLEGQCRRDLFTKAPPKVVYISSARLNCAKNGDFEKYKGSAVCYCWFIWEKGFKGDTTIKWFN